MINYAKINSNFSYLHSIIMYHIVINNETAQSIDNKQIAFANFRALCRDYKNKPSSIKLMLDDKILHAKSADLQLLDDIDSSSTNDVLFEIMKQHNISKATLSKLIKGSDLEVSNSRVSGWCSAETDKRFVKLNNDELTAILLIITDYLTMTNYSKQNVVKARKLLNMTQTDLGELLQVNDRQVRNWESGKNNMPIKKWQILQEKLKNI